MARELRLQYLGAIDHVMNRGDHWEVIFCDEEDRGLLLATLGEGCQKSAWQVHSLCLMSNHFHLVIATPNVIRSIGRSVRPGRGGCVWAGGWARGASGRTGRVQGINWGRCWRGGGPRSGTKSSSRCGGAGVWAPRRLAPSCWPRSLPSARPIGFNAPGTRPPMVVFWLPSSALPEL